MKPISSAIAPILLLLAARPSALSASDHLDGPATTAHRVTDLTDLYAFPTPDKPGFLTIILDAYPAVAPEGHFSDKVDYTIRVRRASIRTGGPVGFDTRDEVAIRCTFFTPEDDDAHTAACRTDAGLQTSVPTNRVMPPGPGDGFRLYAGKRSDPFFFNAIFAAAYSDKGVLITPFDQDLLEGFNTLSVIIEVEITKLFPRDTPTLLAIAAESTTRYSPDSPIRRLDRIGRPEITNVALIAHSGEEDLRDPYNAEPPFAVPPDHARVYQERIKKNLSFFDAIDQRIDWTDADRAALSAILVDDFLVVDVARPCAGTDYLEIERSLLTRTAHQTCGGRKPSEDVMDVLFGLYTGGPGGQPIRDGVDQPGLPLLNAFPWLAEPDSSTGGGIKTSITNGLLESGR